MTNYSMDKLLRWKSGAASSLASPGFDRNVGIDAGRVVGLVAVVSIHLSPVFYSSYLENFLFSQLSRFAVPFFFITSGYFSYEKMAGSLFATVARSFRRILLPLLFWIAFYNLGAILQGNLELRWLITGGAGFHLWFLSSLAMALVLASVILRSTNLIVLIGLSTLLYVLGLAYGSYGPMLHLSFPPWLSTRDGPFFALPFITIGCVLKRSGASTSLMAGFSLFVLGAFAQLAEAYWLGRHGFSAERVDYCVATLVFGSGAFLFFQALRDAGGISLIALGGPMTFAAYAIHGWVLGQIQAASAFGAIPIFMVMGAAAISLLLSFLASFAFR